MSKYLSCAETAKLVRKALAEAFPGVKFSVRSSTYAGGASISVAWTDGPSTKQVDPVVKVFAGSTFDGMTDMKSSTRAKFGGEVVRFGSDYVFTSRQISAATLVKVSAAIETLSANERNRLAYRVRPIAASMTDGEMPNDQDLHYVAYSMSFGQWPAQSALANSITGAP